MKNIMILLFLILLVLAGCTRTIQVQGVEKIEGISNLNYVTYLYSSGPGERFRAAFLKDPSSDLDVIASSIQIRKTTGTVEDAIGFMQRGQGYKRVDIQSVSYNNKHVGYLITQPAFALAREYIEVNLFERGGKIYFSVRENYYND
jgi:hypothetical protein